MESKALALRFAYCVCKSCGLWRPDADDSRGIGVVVEPTFDLCGGTIPNCDVLPAEVEHRLGIPEQIVDRTGHAGGWCSFVW